MQGNPQALETSTDEPSLLDLCDDLLLLKIEAERYAKPPVCAHCRPGNPCWFHQTFEQRQRAAARKAAA